MRKDPQENSPGRLDRRQALLAGGGLMGLGLSGLFGSAAAHADEPAPQPAGGRGISPDAKAKSVILVFLNGGPSQHDTFDPKPGIGAEYTGKFDTDLATNVPGIHICQVFPLLAQQADKYSLIRTMTHGDYGHETAALKVLTGTPGRGDLSYPLVGSVIAEKKYESGYRGALPPFIVLGSPFTRVGGAGFLGRRCEAYVTSSTSSQSAGAVRQTEARRALLQSLDAVDGQGSDAIREIEASQESAYGLLLGKERTAFDLAEEPATMQVRYGNHSLGRRCLQARRLVEHGVPYVAINHGGWDTHSYHFEAMERNLGPNLDQALSALIVDLHERGLLSSTVVLCIGEFGRTPKVQYEAPWFGGRDHWGPVFSALIAGGGFRSGQVVGQSDRTGAQVASRPVYPWDLWGSIYQLMGIDPNGLLPHPEGRAVRVLPNDVPRRGGLLTEIM